MRLSKIAELANGELCKGDPDLEIVGVASVSEATPQDITFFVNPKYLPVFRACKAGAAFVPKDFSGEAAPALIKVESPSVAFGILVKHFAPPPIVPEKGVHPTAIIGKDVVLGEGVSVQAYAVIEPGAKIGARTVICAYSYVGQETQVGEDCHLHARVTIMERCTIGNRVIIHPGAVIGADGFGYEPPGKTSPKYVKVPHTGIVQIDDEVEIGANSTVDRARFGRTWIKEGCKIDNLVMIGHNVVLGPHTVLCGQVGISGSSHVGAYTTLAGQVGVAGHLEVGDHVILMAQSGVAQDVPDKASYFGTPAEPAMDRKRRLVYGSPERMEKLMARVKALEEKK